MNSQTLDGRNPAAPARPRQPLPIALLLGTVALLLVSVVWCALAWTNPDRFIFLPGGDVGLGFKSHAGQLQWIEYAPWDSRHTDYPHWTVPWIAVISVELLLLAAMFWLHRRLKGRIGTAT